MNYLFALPTIFIWWYSRGISVLFDFLYVLLVHFQQMFAPLELVKTLFAPWKRLLSPQGRGLEALRDWLVDNLVSRAVGFVMRIFLLILYFIFVIFYLCLFAVSIVFWLGMPAFLLLSIYVIFI